MDFIAEFIDDMRAKGNAPANLSEIIADDKKHRYTLDGERGKKSGAYQLRVDGDFAVGWHRSFKEGVTHRWNSRSSKQFTPAEKAAWKERVDRERAAQAAKMREEQDAAAGRAAKIWAKASKEGTTGYLTHKQVDRHGARVWNGMLVVPVWVAGKLRSLQFIGEDGQKKFVKESEIVGGYFSINAKDDSLDTIVICEGFATGGTIRKVTGFPVIVAFNAGNLKSVAIAFRNKYPKSRFIFAADNDQWTTKPDGTEWNPGVKYAEQAAVAIGGAPVVWPIIASDDPKRRTDWNDVAVTEGIEVVKNRFTAVLAHTEKGAAGSMGGSSVSSPEVPSGPDSVDVQAESVSHHFDEDGMPMGPPLEAYEDILPSIRSLVHNEDWGALLLKNGEGKLKTGSLRNAILFLKFHPDFRNTFAYNEFHQNIMVVRCPPWKQEEDFSAEPLSDIVITNTAAELEKYGLTPSTEKAFKAIQAVAHEMSFHPARTYFNSLVWDKQPRLHKWLPYYLGCEQENADYLAFVGTKWMVAAVNRVYEPGCKFDHILVIEGEQGSGKSTALKELATFGREVQETYFTDAVTIADIQNKDTIMKIQGSIIVELSELSGFSKKDDEEVKRWITVQHDDVRTPYGRTITRFSRQFVLAASTNQSSYLKDPTGNRRYWVVMAQHIDLAAIREDREQLWAEAVHLYRQGTYIGPTREEERLANAERQKRLSHDIWTDEVLKYASQLWMRFAVSGERGFKVSEVMTEMGMPLRERDDRSTRRISGILQLAGYINKPMWNGQTKKTERYWVGEEARNE